MTSILDTITQLEQRVETAAERIATVTAERDRLARQVEELTERLQGLEVATDSTRALLEDVRRVSSTLREAGRELRSMRSGA